MRRIVCSVLLIAVGMVFGAVAGEAMESRTYPMSVFFEEKLYAAAESAGIPCQWDDPEKWDLSVFELLGVDWPEGSSIKRIKSLGTMTVHNTPGNLSKFERILDEFELGIAQIELDVRFVSAGRAALEAVGYFDTNRVDAAVLQERLMARDDVKLLEAPRVITRPGEEAFLKGVLECIYPTDYYVNHACTSQAVGTNTVYGSDSAGAAVEPQCFTMREVGTFVQVTPTLTADGKVIDIELDAQLVGEPEWKDYGAKAKWKDATTYDLPMEQPFFPVRASADTKIGVRPGSTCVFGGGADRRKGDEDKFVLIFVTPRLVDP